MRASYRKFEQSMHLPEDVQEDKVSAKYEDGVLVVTMPRKHKKGQTSKRIDIE